MFMITAVIEQFVIIIELMSSREEEKRQERLARLEAQQRGEGGRSLRSAAPAGAAVAGTSVCSMEKNKAKSEGKKPSTLRPGKMLHLLRYADLTNCLAANLMPQS
jgi:hypothetical protein